MSSGVGIWSVVWRCLSTAGGKATYAAATTVGGHLVLKGALKLDLPKPLDKVIELGEIPVPIPALVRPLDFAAADAAGVADGKAGACDGNLPAPPPEDSGDAGGGTTPLDSGVTDGGKGEGLHGRALWGVAAQEGATRSVAV